MNKIKKQSIPNGMKLISMVKLTLKRFGFIKHSSGFLDGEKIVALTTMDAFVKTTEEEKVYTEKDSKMFRQRSFMKTITWLLQALAIGLRSRVFANGPGDRGSIPGRFIPKSQKMIVDATLLNTQHYEVRIKGKVEKSREWSSALPYTSV